MCLVVAIASILQLIIDQILAGLQFDLSLLCFGDVAKFNSRRTARSKDLRIREQSWVDDKRRNSFRLLLSVVLRRALRIIALPVVSFKIQLLGSRPPWLI